MTTFKGSPVTLEGKELAVGDLAPDFQLTATDLTKKSLADFAAKKKVISVVPSVDTGVCASQTRQFNEALADKDDTVVITVSVDLPFAQERWCAASGLDNVLLLSDYYDHSFGKSYGLLIKELHLLARTVLILDENNRITYLQQVQEVGDHPDYDAALAALDQLD